ncbi:receptor-like serine/threonine-protein kinase ALE2 isoform X2 [Lactuca sativa]|uniref:receptor-like serine/threonine-protein kinase ALE2 isoform X2 n=1 Tax=Lactuca sativa TaxID=4236 RepID=UPI0022AF2663|nr:receptor-like serine/threonine-protein kinase ALE2 isoform X2 [Lactuca sativa]
MGLMVKYFFLVLQVCAIASTLVLEVSSGQTISPSASFSGAPPINEGQIISNSPGPTSQPNDPPHFESPNQPPPNAGGPIISIPESSPPSPPAVPPTVPVSVPPIPQPEKGPDSKSPVSPPTMSGPMASPPNKLPEASPPTNPTLPITPPNLPLPVDLPPSSPPTLPPSPPILPVPVDLPPSTLPSSPPTLPLPSPNLPAPSASPPSTLPINSPPTPPISTIPPPNSPAPMASPPITLPRNSPPTPPISAIPPPNSPVPIASPSPPSPVASSPPPSSAASPPPPPSVASSPPPPSVASSPLPSSVASPPPPSVASSPPPSPVASSSPPPSNLPGPVALPPRNLPGNLQPIHHNSSIPPPNLPVSPISTPIPRDISPVSSPPNRTTNITPPPHSPVKAPVVHHAPPPHSGYKSPPTKSHPPPSLPPLYPPPPPGPASRPMHHRLPPPPPGPASKPSHHTPPPPSLDSAVPPIENSISPSFSPSTTPPPVHSTMPILSPKVSPSRSPPMIPKPFQALPPPPPNEDCSSIVCVDPLTNTPPGTPCKCVLPMQVELRLSISLYTFFPLVSELAFEMASGLFLKSSQVRIMGANEDNQDQEKTIAIINLVPLGEIFENYTAYVVAQRLWMKQVPIKSSLFGDYEVLFVKYPGLPPSPPLPSSSYNGEPYGHGNNGRDVKPLGVDVSKQRHSNKLNSGLIAIIAFSVVVAVVLVGVVVWVLVFKDRNRAQSGSNPPATLPSVTKSSGVGASIGSGPESNSLSFRSSIAYTGSAKTFSSSEMEKATDNFNESGVLGEGGFGRVYNGVLEDGTKVAVKVLKRDDQQGGREFLAEVEMLSRLHHRNLVRLIGICTEEKNRCLVYELIPNGSVESHLHGIDKETSPLDWRARLKIALGAARGLAYLHEDSSPRVIHRDFKSSNILLEDDFTPKVSDFGLARTALDEDNRHISTRVMGTFGYVAPEYAMTGHLLVKSDVYSYGVVLLELLTGRKPVDMSMPSGQENLVAWARPLLPSPEGLNLLIDPSLSPEVPFDSIAKVAAIASMCVQPEVSHRPFMGEVVQALKLVCNECEETQDLGSRSCSQEDLASMEFDQRAGPESGPTRSNYTGYESPLDVESGFSGLGLDVDSYRISSSSGPLRPRRRLQLWERMKRFSSGSMSDYGEVLRLLSRSR